jgi:hypothetical protein
LDPSRYPQLNKPYTVFFMVVGISLGGFLAYSAVFNVADIVASVIAIVCALASVVGTIYIVYRAAQLKIDETGISSGRTNIEWREITSVEWVPPGLHIKAGRRKIVIAPYIYQDSDDIFQLIAEAVENDT